VLLGRLEDEQDASVKAAILLSLGEYGVDRLSLAKQKDYLPRVLHLYRDDTDPGIHGAAEWLLRRWQMEDKMKAIDKTLTTGKVEGKRLWYLNDQGYTMIVVSNPRPFWMTYGIRQRRWQQFDRGFAIASKEVTVDQFLRFRKDFPNPLAPTKDCPKVPFSWFDAAEYCNWLSQQEGLPKNEWCYEPNEAGKYRSGMKLASNYLRRTGYRIPTEAEWEYSCRAGAGTAYAFGESAEVAGKYAWSLENSFKIGHPVGLLKPNDLGLFDAHGNALEWVDEWVESALTDSTIPVGDGTPRLLRGGSFFQSVHDAQFPSGYQTGASHMGPQHGLRLARTLPPT
jgi:formylglycine-generating enzyme required for sulfatase activity